MIWLSDILTARKQKQFVKLHLEHCGLLLRAAETLERFMEGPTPDAADRIAQLAKESDGVLKETITALADTFVTPFDRQDIYALAIAIDEMISYLNNAAREIVLFKVEPTPQMVEIAKLMVGAAAEIIASLQLIVREPLAAVRHATRASDVENQVEDIYRHALAELFETSDVQRIFKLREVYRHLSNVADRADAIGKLLGKIAVKVA
ncbi:MAG TPA: DUF47 family protein [Candidatus Eremiobacteraceae bacterium]|nr:DUF47 family protein [Candidatus Eremiobacteraceae bacterium]